MTEIPLCPDHKYAMAYTSGGFSRTKKDEQGNPKRFSPSYRCQIQGCKQLVWLPDAPEPRTAQPGPPGPPPGFVDVSRSIQVQCAIKCACIALSNRPDVDLDGIMLLASHLDIAMTRGARVPAISAVPVLRWEGPQRPAENYAQPDPGEAPEWTASHPDEPPPDDNDPWAQDWQNRSRA